MLFVVIFLVLVIGVLIFIVSNLLRQISILETELTKGLKPVEELETVYQFFLQLFTRTLADMDRVDRLGAFKNDDEVGYIFGVLLESIKQVKFQIEKLKKSPEDEDVEGDGN